AAMRLGTGWHSVVIMRDVTERKRSDAAVRSMARLDSLTGLVNRAVFVESLEQAIARAQRGGTSFAVLYLDLDHFKDVNDTLGHPIGDLLLQQVGQRLLKSSRKSDTVARFGGDEFAIIVEEIRDPADAASFALKVLKEVGQAYTVQGKQIHTGSSIGVAVYGTDANDPETLLSQADVALYRAKAEGRGIYRFFTDAMDAEVRTRVKLEAELRKAIAAGEFFLMYQPQVDANTGSVVGLEALVRWHKPDGSQVMPGEFIPAAERCGLIVPLGHWVLHEACRQAKEWLDTGLTVPL